MRASIFAMLMYAGIIGVPVLLIIFAYVLWTGYALATTVISLVLIPALLLFSLTGVKEVFLHNEYPLSNNRLERGDTFDNKEAPKIKSGAEVSLVIRRFNPETSKMDSTAYKFFANKFTTVLDALLGIKAYQDNTVSVRCNCRMGICGSCGMVVNGKPVLACETNLLESAEGGSLEVAPMKGHPLLKDIVTDFDDFFKRHESVEPTLYRIDEKEKFAAKQEYKQSKEEVDKFLPYSYCIMCGLCLDACPVVNSNPNFIGPQALSQTYRYYADSRDQKGKKRLFDADTLDGAWGCEFSGSCSKACPKGVDPSSAIQLIKGELMKNISEDEKE